jgi:hypothetical protein
MCSLLALLSCFSMNGFYVDAQLIHSNKGAGIVAYDYVTATTHIKGYGPVNVTYPVYRVEDEPRNPYGRISIGYDVKFSDRFSMSLDYSHESSLATNKDRGEERISLGVTWRPFAK